MFLRLLKEKIQHGCGDRALETQDKNRMSNEVSEPENEEEDNNMQIGDKNEDTEGQAKHQALDTDLRAEVDNFPDYSFTLELKKTRSFKHKKQDIINEHRYMMRVITDPPPTLGEIIPNLRALFISLLEEINHAYRPNDLGRILLFMKKWWIQI